MAVKNTAVFGIYPDRPAVEEAFTHFLRAGFRKADVSALFPENPGSKDLGHEKNTKAPEGIALGAIVGLIICGVLAWLIAAGSVSVPALSALASAGLAVAILAGIGAGAVIGGIIGGLIGLAIPEYEARRYAGRIRGGGVLVSVHCDNHDWAKRAKSILEQSGAQDIGSAMEKNGDYGNADKPVPRIRTIRTDDTERIVPEDEKPSPTFTSKS